MCVCSHMVCVCVTIVIKEKEIIHLRESLGGTWEHLKKEKERKIKKGKGREKEKKGKEEIMYSYFNCFNL